MKRIFILLGLVVAILASITFFSGEPEKNNALDKQELSTIDGENSKDLTKNFSEMKESQQEEMVESLNYQAELEIKRWMLERGHPVIESDETVIQFIETDYSVYTEEDLIIMASNDDKWAQLEISKKYLAQAKFEEAEEYLFDASVNGFSKTLLDLSAVYMAKSMKARAKEDSVKELEYLIESQAWLEVASKRVDPWASISKKHYEHKVQSLTENQRKKLQSRPRRYIIN